MNNIEKPKFDRNTLGNSPGCLYMMDLLNETSNKKDLNVLKFISKFRHIFFQLVHAYDEHVIEADVVRVFSSYKRTELISQVNQLIEQGYTPVIAKLYCNIVISDLRKFERAVSGIQKIEKSAIDRAKSQLKNKHISVKNKEVLTYGRINQEEADLVNVTVVFDKNGKGQLETPLTRQDFSDPINDETLMQKSRARLIRLGKLNPQDVEFKNSPPSSNISPFTI